MPPALASAFAFRAFDKMCCLIVSRESLRRQINDLVCNRVRFPKRVCLTLAIPLWSRNNSPVLRRETMLE